LSARCCTLRTESLTLRAVEISPTDVNVARTRDRRTLSIFSNAPGILRRREW